MFHFTSYFSSSPVRLPPISNSQFLTVNYDTFIYDVDVRFSNSLTFYTVCDADGDVMCVYTLLIK